MSDEDARPDVANQRAKLLERKLTVLLDRIEAAGNLAQVKSAATEAKRAE